MNNKLIVNVHQARMINENLKCEIAVDMRIKDGYPKEFLAAKKFKDQVFWVAEPTCCIKRDIEKHHRHFACDPTPEGWARYTLNRPGSRIHFGEHRHLVKCTDVRVSTYGSGQMFTVFIQLERVGGGM